MIDSINVVAGIILNQDKTKVLMSQRTDKDYIYQWEFPGGKIEKNETPDSALQRELMEELGIKVLSYNLYKKKSHHYLATKQHPEKMVHLTFFWITKFSGTPSGLENQPVAWHDVKVIDQLDFLKANEGIMQDVQSHLLGNDEPNNEPNQSS